MRTNVRSLRAIAGFRSMLQVASLSQPSETDLSPQDLRRAQILDAARHCFAKSGFHGASMQQICAEAKMSPGALYRYFPSKDAIIDAIAEDERAIAATVMQDFRGSGCLVDRLITSGMRYLRQMQRPDSARLMAEIMAETMRSTGLSDRFNTIEMDVREEFLRAFKEAQDTGEIATDVDIEAAIMVMMAIGDGLVLRMGIENEASPEIFEPFLRRIVPALLKSTA